MEETKPLTYRQALTMAERKMRRNRKVYWIMEKDGAFAAIEFGKISVATADGWIKRKAIRSV